MNELHLSLTTRGVQYRTRQYLADVKVPSSLAEETIKGLPTDTPFSDALPVMRAYRSRPIDGPAMEYGCFNLDGSLIEDPSQRFMRQGRNILYYTIRDYFNMKREQWQYASAIPLGYADPVPHSPTGAWAALLSEACSEKASIELALKPLIEHRDGEIIFIPRLDPPNFLTWLQERFGKDQLPPYLLVCDTLENIPIEYQFIFNAFAVSGRLCLDDPDLYAQYVNKVMDVETGRSQARRRCLVASPADDTVTFVDMQNIIKPILEIPFGESLQIDSLLSDEFNERFLLDAAEDAGFLALYCHGVGLSQEDFEKTPDLQGAFLLRYESKEDEGILTADEVADHPFVPGGIVFSPACLAGGTVSDSDFVDWLEPEQLAPYLGGKSMVSAISRSMLSAPRGPIAVFTHFDISIASNALLIPLRR